MFIFYFALVYFLSDSLSADVWGALSSKCVVEKGLSVYQVTDRLKLEKCHIHSNQGYMKANCGSSSYLYAETLQGCENALKELEIE